MSAFAFVQGYVTFLGTDIALDGTSFEGRMRAAEFAVRGELRRRGLTIPSFVRPRRDDLDSLITQEHDFKDEWDNALRVSASDDDLEQIAGPYLSVLRLVRDEYDTRLARYWRKIAEVFGSARGDLIANIGQYCSYCEMPLAASLAVEHMLPKSTFPSLAVDWTNFLLACPICNSTKNNKPSLADAKAAAADPTQWASVQAGATSKSVWPSDAYSFGTSFGYQVHAVLYDSSGNPLTNRDATAQLNVLGRRRRMLALPDAGGGYMRVRLLTRLGRLQGGDAAAASAYLNAPAAAQMPAALRTALSDATHFASDEPIVADPRGLALPASGGTITVNVVTAGQEWALIHAVPYALNTAGGRVVLTSGGTEIYNQRRPVDGPWLSALRSRVLTEDLATLLNVDRFVPTITYVAVDRNSSTFTVERRYRLRVEPPYLVAYYKQELPIEVRLAGATVKAAYAVTMVALNAAPRSDPKESDRRTKWRARAYLAALDAVNRLEDTIAHAAALPQLQRDAVVGAMEAMIVEQAKATGFWSVWWSIAGLLAPPVAGPLRTALAAAFPGTR